MATVTIARNATTAKLVNASADIKALVSNALSYTPAGAQFSEAFQNHRWDGRSSFFSHSKATFPAGFTRAIVSTLKKSGHRVSIVAKDLPKPLGAVRPNINEFGYTDEYSYQPETVDKLVERGGMIAQIATGGGKCLGRDTTILMYDGTIKMVQDVIVGDILMGPDSKPRHVLSTVADFGKLYRVTPNKGDSYVVNDAHILSLKKTSRGHRGLKRDGEKYPKGEIVNINVEDFISETKTFRHIHKGWRTGVDFSNTESLSVDPYFVGLLLGDGSINGRVSLTTADSEMIAEVDRQAAIWNLSVRSYGKSGSNNKARTYYITGDRFPRSNNPLTDALRALGLGYGCKFIPHSYLTGSRFDRLEMLAGIIDTDGYYDDKCFYVTLKEERLLDDVIYLSRSLGFSAYKKKVKKTCCNNGKVGDYFSTVISGNLDLIPVRLERRKANPRLQKKDPLVVGISVESIGYGEYFGFEIDGDHLFMLGDFTVTHNTAIAAIAIARIKRPTLFITTRGVLLYQMKDALEKSFKYRALNGEPDMAGVQIGVIGDGIWSPKKVTVAMVQTLAAKLKDPDPFSTPAEQRRQLAIQERVKKLLSRFEMVILEEAHEASGESYYGIMKACVNAHYRLALTATPFMKDDVESNMRLMACVGPIGIKVTEKELIDKGILAKPIFKYIDNPKSLKLFKGTSWRRAYKLGITDCKFRNGIIVSQAKIMKGVGLTGIVLVQHTSHGETLKTMLTQAGLKVEYMRGSSSQEARTKSLNRLGAGLIDVLIGTTVLDVGVDVPSVGYVILGGGGKAEVNLRQRIGRILRRKKVGPNIAFVFDFMDSHNQHTRDHARERRYIVENTPGFGENILADGKNFDFSIFKKLAV